LHLFAVMTHQDTRATTLPKRARGRTAIEETPIVTRSRVSLSAVERRSIEERLRRALAPFGTRIERASIRFEDLNGPRGGVDIHCTIKVVFSGSDSIIIEQRAADVVDVVRRAMPRVARNVRSYADRSGRKTPRATAGLRRAATPKSAPARAQPSAAQDTGSIIGKRAGRGKASLALALERPEKLRRDAYVDTAEPGVNETDRKAGGQLSARRNSKLDTSGMTSALEDSRGKPSRKSTRGSTQRSKAATQLTRRALRKVRSPQARAAKSSA
jgi:hypothetical protein